MATFTDRKFFRTTLDAFYGALRPKLDHFQAERAELNRCEASRFNVFTYIRPDENCLSDIHQDLLDSTGKHGQGAIFLNSFLEGIGVPLPANHPVVRLKREDRTLYCANFERRIDITVDLGDFANGIENKPWACEGKDQLKDYWVHLRRKYKQRYMLVYLSRDGSEPVSLSKKNLARLSTAGKFRSLAYPTDLRNWLARCFAECEADKVRWFLRDLAEFVTEEFEIAEGEEPVHEAN